MFQSTLPAWGSDKQSWPGSRPASGFNPRSPRGGATWATADLYGATGQFQSTLPAWGSDKTLEADNAAQREFQSTLPAWGSDRR